MPAKIDITGQRFGRLVAIRDDGRTETGRVVWLCRCDCGIEKRIDGVLLRRSKNGYKSCGCKQSPLRHGHSRRGHKSPTFTSWQTMRNRCNNPDSDHFKWYGARGITICARWDEFENFLADMGERPAKRSIDRIDNNGNYEPGNCRWATQAEQLKNRRARRL